MKLHSFTMVALAIVPGIAAAQVPPTPPTPPAQATPPAQVAPPVSPAPLPRVEMISPAAPGQAIILPDFLPDGVNIYRAEDLRRMAEDARIAGEAMRFDGLRLAEEGRLAAQRAAEEYRFDALRLAEEARHGALGLAHIAGQGSYAPDVFSAPGLGFGVQGPRAPWAQGDPADSLYRLAREALNRTDYTRSAGYFSEILSKFPNSQYAGEAAYYEPFARYRIGTESNLRTALRVLDTHANKLQYTNRRQEALQLRARVLGALAERGDGNAREELKKLYAANPGLCDAERIQLQSTVLNSMYHSDPESTMSMIRGVLDQRDACSAPVRRTALLLLGNRPDESRASLVANVARNDTVRSVRSYAIDMLAKMPGDAPVTVLQELTRDTDSYIQSAAVKSLMQSQNPRARSAMRTLIDNRNALARQRVDAIRSYNRTNMTDDDVSFLRGVFNRQGEAEEVRAAIVSTLANVQTDETTKFLLDVARNESESTTIRSAALSRVSRMNLSDDDLGKLYDASSSRPMRQQLVRALAERKTPAADAKLLEIVRLSTDPTVQEIAISQLISRKNPELTRKVGEILARGGL